MRFVTIIFLSVLLFTAVSAQTPKARPTPAKPKAAAVKPKPAAAKKPDESSEWEKAIAVSDTATRIVAVRKFVAKFPRFARRTEAGEMLVTLGSALGNEKLQAGDAAAAAEIFRAAAKDAPRSIPERSWALLAKFPTNLYFRGFRAEALEITRILEDKSASNAGQMLEIATFYLSVENGSEAKRVAEKVIATEPSSSAAYETLGLATRMDFNLEESAAAYAKALELNAESVSAKRGLAEMKRSLGKADEAVTLYREILAKDEANVPARTGLILSLFDAEKRADAEAELAKALEATPNNVILAAGAAYWYAVRNEGDKAVEMAQKAIAADPRFIWSHIALARGYLSQKKPAEAEKTLLAARRYGNFPTLEYEIASARLASGFYRDAAEELAKSFTVKEGTISTKLGGRVERSSANFTELVGYERRASIFAPTAADDPEMAARLTALLELKQELDRAEPRPEIASKAVDEFVKGSDAMKVHRQIFAASELVEKKVALSKAIEMTTAATANVDAGLDAPSASSAVLASELYERRSVAAIRNEYLNVPDVPKTVLGNIVRGRIDDIAGWAAYQMNDANEAVVRLKRAVAVLPADSAWWRSSTWRLAAALAAAGNDKDALAMYIKSYRISGPSPFRWTIIEALYKKVNGSTEGLETQIGPNPLPTVSTEAVAKTETIPEPTPVVIVEASPDTPTATPEPAPQNTPDVSIKTEEPTTPPMPTSTPEESPAPLPAEPSPTPVNKTAPVSKELFPPVVITIPPPDTSRSTPGETGTATPTPTPAEKVAAPTPTPEPVAVKNCKLTVSEESITVQSGGGDLAVIVGSEDDGDLEGLTATSTSPEDVSVRRENTSGVKSRALFVVRAVSSKTGVYQIRFEMPCGKREITVRVR